MTITKLNNTIIINSIPIDSEIFERDMVEFRIRNTKEDMDDLLSSPTFMYSHELTRLEKIKTEWYFVSVDTDELVDQNQDFFNIIANRLIEMSETMRSSRRLN